MTSPVRALDSAVRRAAAVATGTTRPPGELELGRLLGLRDALADGRVDALTDGRVDALAGGLALGRVPPPHATPFTRQPVGTADPLVVKPKLRERPGST